jgi:hypothetical protein
VHILSFLLFLAFLGVALGVILSMIWSRFDRIVEALAGPAAADGSAVAICPARTDRVVIVAGRDRRVRLGLAA